MNCPCSECDLGDMSYKGSAYVAIEHAEFCENLCRVRTFSSNGHK